MAGSGLASRGQNILVLLRQTHSSLLAPRGCKGILEKAVDLSIGVLHLPARVRLVVVNKIRAVGGCLFGPSQAPSVCKGFAARSLSTHVGPPFESALRH